MGYIGIQFTFRQNDGRGGAAGKGGLGRGRGIDGDGLYRDSVIFRQNDARGGAAGK